MLVSLLPGLRDLRAPLAAGYLWLLVAWLVAEPNIDEWREGSGALASLVALGDDLGAAGIAVAVSFLAYLVGSLSELVSGEVGARIPPRVRRGDELMRGLMPWVHERVETAGRAGVSIDDVQRFIAREAPPDPRLVRFAFGSDSAADPDDESFEGLGVRLTAQVNDELDVVADRLLDEKSDLYGPIDRLRGEVELRSAIALPLAAVLTVLAVVANPLWALGLVAVGGLLFDAERKRAARHERLRAALTTKPTRSPMLDRIERTIDAAVERAERERAETEAAEKAAREAGEKRKRDAEWFEGERRAAERSAAPADG